jgi:hypothetical protein
MCQKMQEAVLAAVRLQAAARRLLARRQAREMRELQLVCNIPDVRKQLKLDYEASSSINIK